MRPDSIGPVPESLLKPRSLLHRPQRLPLLQQTFQSSKESQLRLELWQTPVKFGVCHFRPCWPSVVLGRPQSSLSKWTVEMWSWYQLVTPCREDNTGLREQMQSDTVTTYWKKKYILDISSLDSEDQNGSCFKLAIRHTPRLFCEEVHASTYSLSLVANCVFQTFHKSL